MPTYRKTQKFNTDTRRYGSGTGTIKQHEEEQRIANAIIDSKIELKENPLSRMVGLKTTVIYYQQKTTSKNNHVINTSNLSSIELNKMKFIKIKDFIIIGQGENSVQQNQPTESSVDFIVDGQAKVLPRTIKPQPNDHFIMNTYNKLNLYRVTNVNKTTIEDDAAYEFSYELVEERSEEFKEELELLTVETRIFVYSHVGTSFRTIFKEDEYETLENLESMYIELGKIYNDLFYDKERNTYILKYTKEDLFETNDADRPYIVAPEENKKPDNGSQLVDGHPTPPHIIDDGFSPNFNNSNLQMYFGDVLYDRMLVNFIQSNEIFSHIERKVYCITQLKKDVKNQYSKTLYHALETKSNMRFKYRFLYPVVIDKVTIADVLNTYGLTLLEPSIEKRLDSLDIYPNQLISAILWDRGENSNDYLDAHMTLNSYKSVIDFMCEIVSLYMKKKNKFVLERLRNLYKNKDELVLLSEYKLFTFYLYPIISYVILDIMDELSDDNFGIIDEDEAIKNQ